MKIFFWLLFVLGVFASWSAETPTGWHDPALDAINNNMGYLDADLNGNFEFGPQRWGATNIELHFGPQNVRDRLMQSNNATMSGLGLGQYTPYVTTNQAVVFNGSTNWNALTNAVNSMFGKFTTNLSHAVANSIIDQYMGENEIEQDQPGFSIPVISSGVNGFSGEIYLGLNRGAIGSFPVKIFRWMVLAVEYALFFQGILAALRGEASETLNQRQTQGSLQALLGTNVSMLSSWAYSTVICAGVCTAVTVVLTSGMIGAAGLMGKYLVLWSQTGGIGSPAFAGAVGPAWHLITTWIPVVPTIGIFLSYLVFRYLLLVPVFFMVRGIILYLPV